MGDFVCSGECVVCTGDRARMGDWVGVTLLMCLDLPIRTGVGVIERAFVGVVDRTLVVGVIERVFEGVIDLPCFGDFACGDNDGSGTGDGDDGNVGMAALGEEVKGEEGSGDGKDWVE
eukprot:TRINITY_DN8614_c0_g3_i1.p3 TRINITY_DN8614_c0_g3~~TRINITY_DN8614_c0_g3_i1.p3  ORF type:complete len:118 (-),score=2.00 TRINITY_DN8614_c0_g3_i1:51-404(-)